MYSEEASTSSSALTTSAFVVLLWHFQLYRPEKKKKKQKNFENNVDPDEMARLIRVYTVCLFYFAIILFGILVFDYCLRDITFWDNGLI